MCYMAKFSKKRKRKNIGIVWAELLLLAALVLFAVWLWYEDTPRFHDVSIELGTQGLKVEDFLEDPSKAERVTMTSTIDYNKLGKQKVTFQFDTSERSATLEIVDTVAPKVEFRDVLAQHGQTVVPEDFVLSAEDLSVLTYTADKPLTGTDTYEPLSVEITVKDAAGNQVKQICVLRFVWLPESYTLEVGQTLTKDMLLADPANMEEYLDQKALDEINASGVGQYTLTSTFEGVSCTCLVTVTDTVAPELEARDVSIGRGETAQAEDFVVRAEDASGEVTVEFSQEPDYSVMGPQTATILPKDRSGNTASAQAVLTITGDTTAPTFSGLGTLTVQKNSTPDYRDGVSANDDMDGTVSFSFDASQVNMTQAGTYYVTYYARDDSGNEVSKKRTVVVTHDQADIDALVAEIADTLPNDPEKIRDYVRNNIR